MKHCLAFFSLVACLAAPSLPWAQVLAQTQHASPARFVRPDGTVPAPFPNVFTRERAKLLEQGEAALAQLDTATAIDAFERAGYLFHAPDAETALVRAHMQAGNYRQALAFAAHTAGMHPNDPSGTALYAWLLQLGGQREAARNVLKKAEQRLPDDPLLGAVKRQLVLPSPTVSATMQNDMQGHTLRLVPYGSDATNGLPGTAAAVGSGVLIDEGRQAIAPLDAIKKSDTVWLRNGLGMLAKAVVVQRFAKEGLALLALDAPLPYPAETTVASRDPFPGSVGYAVEYATASHAQPAWPVLTAGFIGAPLNAGLERKLGIELPGGTRGSAVFDAMGRLAGIAVAGEDRQGNRIDRMIPASRLREHVGAALGPEPPINQAIINSPAGRPSADAVYESAMRISLQVLAVQ